jgi:hypothetical protein
MNFNMERWVQMFIHLFVRRLMMSVINWIIGGATRVFHRTTEAFTKRDANKQIESEPQRPQLNDFTNRD